MTNISFSQTTIEFFIFLLSNQNSSNQQSNSWKIWVRCFEYLSYRAVTKSHGAFFCVENPRKIHHDFSNRPVSYWGRPKLPAAALLNTELKDVLQPTQAGLYWSGFKQEPYSLNYTCRNRVQTESDSQLHWQTFRALRTSWDTCQKDWLPCKSRDLGWRQACTKLACILHTICQGWRVRGNACHSPWNMFVSEFHKQSVKSLPQQVHESPRPCK